MYVCAIIGTGVAMAVESDKKIVLLYVLDILKDYTDSDHLLTLAQIQGKLQSIYGVSSNIKSVTRNIDTLIDYGFKIGKHRRKGCFLAERYFNEAEILYLVDAVFSAKSIPSNFAKDLIKKITKDCSMYERKKFKHIYKVNDIARTKNKQLFHTIELLDHAIEHNKKVSFQYNEYDISKKFTPRKDGKQFIMNPYFLVNNRGKYYLVCNYDKYDNLANYKIENISNIQVLDEEIKPLTSLPNMTDFSLEKYVNEHIYMLHGESIKATLKLDSTKVINDVIDWFGDNITIRKNGADEIIVDLLVNEQALIYWLAQYGEHIEILEPDTTRKKYIDMLNSILKKYQESL